MYNQAMKNTDERTLSQFTKAKLKMDAKAFLAYTKYQGKTSEHSRDAAMLVYGR